MWSCLPSSNWSNYATSHVMISWAKWAPTLPANSKTATEISLQVLFSDTPYIFPHDYNTIGQPFEITIYE
jgi:hypothetical protein